MQPRTGSGPLLLLALLAPGVDAALLTVDARGSLASAGNPQFQSTETATQKTLVGADVIGPDSWRASATAGYGTLGAFAEVIVSGRLLTPGGDRAQASAEFRDTWTLLDQPLDTPGVLRITIDFDGTAVPAPNLGATDAYGYLQVSLASLDAVTNPVGFIQVNSGNVRGSIDTTFVSTPLDFLYGRPIDVQALVFATVLGGLRADFGNTATFSRLEIRDGSGNWVPALNFRTDAPGPYPFSPVPAPASLLLLATGVFGLVAKAKRRSAG